MREYVDRANAGGIERAGVSPTKSKHMDQNQTTRHATCELCQQDGGMLVLRTDKLRVIRVADADYPGFYRVIWNDHVAEFTDWCQQTAAISCRRWPRWKPLCEPHCSPPR